MQLVIRFGFVLNVIMHGQVASLSARFLCTVSTRGRGGVEAELTACVCTCDSPGGSTCGCCVVTDAAHPLLMTKHVKMSQFIDGTSTIFCHFDN